eukprot:COSAG06_NODE_31587_length_519_cov_0.530952_1_plen_48_part_10
MPILKDGHVDAHRPQSYYDRGGWRGTWAGEGGSGGETFAPEGYLLCGD